ncbi:MAG: serine/threonine protein kinase [Myxococcales bacterium]|nr:serine/threonine protein kinase [Myxococcales bacterium]
MKFRPGLLVSNKYRIVRQLGAGGMGEVYAAVNDVLQKQIALKVMINTPGPAAIERFFREGIAASRVRHRAIVQIFDAGVHEGAHWLAMELLEGEPLSALLARSGTLPPSRIIPIAREVLGGLAAAHAQGVVHRDLKPENIFLERCSDGLLQPKLLDFGVAKILDGMPRRLTQAGGVVGTTNYLSPEQARGLDDVDGRADIYSMGVILFESLCGQLPFEGTTPYDTVAKALTEAPRDLRQLAPDVPLPLVAVIERCLLADREARPQDAPTLSVALDCALRAASVPFDAVATEIAAPPQGTGAGEWVGAVMQAGRDPTARFRDGEVSYTSIEGLRADLDQFLSHGILWTAGEQFPPPLEEFVFQLRLPGAPSLWLEGQIISRRGPNALIQVAHWNAARLDKVRAACKGPAGEAPRGRGEPVSAFAAPARRPPAPVAPGELPGRAGPVETPRGGHLRESLEERLRVLEGLMSTGDHFQALGIHYHAPPSRIRNAFVAIVKDFGPGSVAYATCPLPAERLTQLARRAWNVLGEHDSRQTYRREVLRVDVVAAARRLFAQAKRALAIGETSLALELLEAAADLDEAPEYRAALRGFGAGGGGGR